VNFLLRNNEYQEKRRKIFVSDMNIGAEAFLYLGTHFKTTVMSPILPLFLHMWTLRKYSRYLKCLDTVREWIHHKKQGNSRINFCPQTVLEVQPHIRPIAILLDFKSGGGAPKTSSVLSFIWKLRATSTHLLSVKLFAAPPVSFKGSDSPWWDRSSRELIHVRLGCSSVVVKES
jgi:hypothetical protein